MVMRKMTYRSKNFRIYHLHNVLAQKKAGSVHSIVFKSVGRVAFSLFCISEVL